MGVYLQVGFVHALLLSIPLAAAFGQPRSYSLAGRLVLEDGLPVSNAEIELDSSDWQEAAEPTLTDAQGRFA